MRQYQPLSKQEAYRIALAEILATAREALRAANVYGWDEGGPLGDALLGIKDCAETVLLHGIVAESSRAKFG